MQNYITQSSNDTFIAMFTHDLKTPVNSIILALETLAKSAEQKLNQSENELLKDVLNCNKYIKNMTDNVLCKYKTEGGHLKLKKEVCSFKELVLKCVDDTKYVLNEKNQKIIFICPQKNTDANVDFIEIKRVIINLITNASEHSPKNSEIIVSIMKTKNKINFSIQDFGYGISISKLSKIFDQYVTLSNKEKKTGTGLGLYVTKLIIDAHNGDIDIDSKRGFGTTISFTIPSN